MDPTQEFSVIIGNLGVQVALLQAENRLLKESIERLQAQQDQEAIHNQ